MELHTNCFANEVAVNNYLKKARNSVCLRSVSPLSFVTCLAGPVHEVDLLVMPGRLDLILML